MTLGSGVSRRSFMGLVSAAAVADKIIDRMQRGLDPLLMRRSMLAFVPANTGSGACLRRKPD